MATNLTDSNLLAVQTLLDQNQQDLTAAAQQHATDQATIDADQTTIEQLQSDVASMKANLIDAPRAALVGATCYSGYQRWAANTTSNTEHIGIWIDSGGHTAQSNPGTNTTPHGTFTWTPGDDLTAARLDFKPGAGFDNLFIYERFPLPTALPTYLVDRRIWQLSAADRAVINCLEWQSELTWNGVTHSMAWQMNFTAKVVRYFDFTNKVWKPVGIPWVDPQATQFEVITEHQLDEGHTTHLAFTLNGVRNVVNVTQAATPTTHGNKFTVSLFQLDSDSHGDPFGISLARGETRYI